MAPPLKGAVVFTNFEATAAEKGQPNETVPREGNSLTPPEAMDALKDLGSQESVNPNGVGNRGSRVQHAIQPKMARSADDTQSWSDSTAARSKMIRTNSGREIEQSRARGHRCAALPGSGGRLG